MKVFRVERTDSIMYCEDISSIVVAVDAMWAEKLARLSSSSMRKAPLKVSEIDLNKEGVILTDNMGA